MFKFIVYGLEVFGILNLRDVKLLAGYIMIVLPNYIWKTLKVEKKKLLNLLENFKLFTWPIVVIVVW